MPAIRAHLLQRLALGALAILPGCRGAAASADGHTVAIGVALNPKDAGGWYDAIELATVRLNREAAEQGYVFTIRRTAPTDTSAVKTASAMMADRAVVGVVGHQGSTSTMNAAAVYADLEHDGRDGMAAIAPVATSPMLSGFSPWVFRMCPTDLQVSRAAARYALDTLHARRVVIIYRNDDFGRSWVSVFADAFAAGGGVVLRRDPFLAGVTEWPAYAAQIARLRPDWLIFAGAGDDARELIATLQPLDVRIPILGSDALASLGRTPRDYADVRVTSFFDPRRPATAEGREFVNEFQQRTGRLPEPGDALAYDAAMVIGHAVLAVGPDRRKVRDYVATIGMSRPAVAGTAGRVGFDARHDALAGSVVFVSVGSGGR